MNRHFIDDKQSRALAREAYERLLDQQVTDAQSPEELARENLYQFINEICNLTLNKHPVKNEKSKLKEL